MDARHWVFILLNCDNDLFTSHYSYNKQLPYDRQMWEIRFRLPGMRSSHSSNSSAVLPLFILRALNNQYTVWQKHIPLLPLCTSKSYKLLQLQCNLMEWNKSVYPCCVLFRLHGIHIWYVSSVYSLLFLLKLTLIFRQFSVAVKLIFHR